MKIDKEKIQGVLEKLNESRELENRVLGIIDSRDTLVRIVKGQEDVEFFEDWIKDIYILYEEEKPPRWKLVKQWWVSAEQFDRLGSLDDKEECLRNLVKIVCYDLGWL